MLIKINFGFFSYLFVLRFSIFKFRVKLEDLEGFILNSIISFMNVMIFFLMIFKLSLNYEFYYSFNFI